ncbi:MAG: T9SS type A sorting domain-containing protein [bacterium]
MVRSIVLDQTSDSLIYAGTNTGVYLTTDAGANWQLVNEGLLNTDILYLAFRSTAPRTVFAGTNGAGIFLTTPPTSIKHADEHQDFSNLNISVEPNPCPDKLTITAYIQKSGKITSGIYDRTGRLTLMLTPRMVSSGRVTWQVDLRRLPPGIYFLVVKTGQKAITRSLVRVN